MTIQIPVLDSTSVMDQELISVIVIMMIYHVVWQITHNSWISPCKLPMHHITIQYAFHDHIVKLPWATDMHYGDLLLQLSSVQKLLQTQSKEGLPSLFIPQSATQLPIVSYFMVLIVAILYDLHLNILSQSIFTKLLNFWCVTLQRTFSCFSSTWFTSIFF